MHTIVKRRKLDDDGNPIGTESTNPLVDTRAYEIEFIDGTTEIITSNIIVDNLHERVDEEGHRKLLLDEIINYRRNNDTFHKSDTFIKTSTGNRRRKITTKGWEICVLWEDVSTNWIALKDIKQSYPIELDDFSQLHGTHEEAAFAWWIQYVDRKRKAMISKLKSTCWQRTHKYGIKIPKSVNEAYEFDEDNGNKLWTDGIKEEMNTQDK